MKQLLILLTTFFLWHSAAQAQIITTVAGGGTANPGDGQPATDAKLNKPTGVAVDAAGNFYICERDEHRVRKVTPDGIISTFAGTGTEGYSGDGGPATAAEFQFPYSIAIDATDNIYIGDQSTVRKINTSGIISTIAGSGTQGYSGDGGLATAAELKGPSGIAVDVSGNLYIADIDNRRIRKVNASGIITTIAGTGDAWYNGDGIPATDANLYTPSGVAVDDVGNIFIVESQGQRVRKINPAGIISTVAGTGTTGYSGDGGPATAAEFDRPIGIALDSYGNIYIGATYNDCVRKINTSGTIATIAGTGVGGSDGDGGSATAARLASPVGLAINPGGDLYICDFGNRKVRKVSGIVAVNPIRKSSANNGMLLYPNPNNGQFNIHVTTVHKEDLRIVITDITGRALLYQSASTNERIPVTLDAPSGIYIVTTITDKHTKSQKINLFR